MDRKRGTSGAGWLSPSLDRYNRWRDKNGIPDASRRDRLARHPPWSEEDDHSPLIHRRRRSSSWSRPRSSERVRRYSSAHHHQGRGRRSPAPYRRRRDASPSPYSPARHYRRRSDDSRDSDSRRHRHRFDPYPDDRERRRRRKRRYLRDDASSDRPRRRRVHRRRGRSHMSPSSPFRNVAASPVARREIHAGVVSEDEQEAAAGGKKSINMVDQLDPPPKKKKRSHSGSMSATSSRDDTVGHFKGGPGTVIANRYRITGDIGMGTFGRVVECIDLKKRKARSRGSKNRQRDRVAIKIVRKVKRYYDSALIEADIVQDVNRKGGRGTSHFAFMYNAFTFSGHFCLVFESLGPSLYDFLKRHDYQPFPMACVRDFARQLLEALEFLHSFGLIHTDLKPENILLTNCRERSYTWRGNTYQIPESTQIKVIDFGGATYDDEKKSSVINTRQYRAPEVIFGIGWSTQSDLWSAGCILAELYMGELLFATHDNIEHLALMERAIGPFSRRMLMRARNSPIAQESFDFSSGRHLLEASLNKESADYVKKMLPLSSIICEEDGRFLRLLRGLLVIDPDERAPASELVNCRL